jgi:hypothetical protein
MPDFQRRGALFSPTARHLGHPSPCRCIPSCHTLVTWYSPDPALHCKTDRQTTRRCRWWGPACIELLLSERVWLWGTQLLGSGLQMALAGNFILRGSSNIMDACFTDCLIPKHNYFDLRDTLRLQVFI